MKNTFVHKMGKVNRSLEKMLNVGKMICTLQQIFFGD
jgi:hypothetical protein